MSTGPVEQLTQQLSTAIVPLTSQVIGGTQTLGATTGAGAPANSLLGTLGGAIANGGNTLTNANVPVVSNLGSVVGALGNTVASLGGVAYSPNASSSNPLAPITGVLGGVAGGGSPLGAVTGVLGGLGGAAGGSRPLAPVSSGLGSVGGATGGSSLLAPVTSALGSLGSAAGGGSPLAPVTGVLSSVGGTTGGTALAPVASITAPVGTACTFPLLSKPFPVHHRARGNGCRHRGQHPDLDRRHDPAGSGDRHSGRPAGNGRRHPGRHAPLTVPAGSACPIDGQPPCLKRIGALYVGLRCVYSGRPCGKHRYASRCVVPDGRTFNIVVL